MGGEYNIVQRLPNGDVTFLRCEEGLEAARDFAAKYAGLTLAEIVVVDAGSNQIAFRINA